MAAGPASCSSGGLRARDADGCARRGPSGQRHAGLVAGEAGIGKSRIAAEVARRARDDGFDVLVGRSIDLVGTQLPYQPVVEALPGSPSGRPGTGGAGSQRRVFEEALAR